MKYLVSLFLLILCFSAIGEVEPSESYIDFWEVELGESEFLDFELVNNHTEPVKILNIDLNADFSAFDLNENCLGVLEPGESCYIEVIFSPYETERYWGSVEIETSTREWIDVDLQGEGVRW